jgi:hypothetical protein
MVGRMMKTIVLATCLSLLVCGTGCKKLTQTATEKALEEGTGAKKVDLDKGNVAVTGANGQQVNLGQNVALPDGWPTSRVPQYPGSSIMASASNNGSMSYTAETTDAPAKVVAFYKDKLSGYKVDGQLNMPQGSTAGFKSAQDEVAVSATAGGGGKTMITVGVTTHK